MGCFQDIVSAINVLVWVSLALQKNGVNTFFIKLSNKSIFSKIHSLEQRKFTKTKTPEVPLDVPGIVQCFMFLDLYFYVEHFKASFLGSCTKLGTSLPWIFLQYYLRKVLPIIFAHVNTLSQISEGKFMIIQNYMV